MLQIPPRSNSGEVAVADNTITIRFGQIGTNGQTQTDVFADDATADKAARRPIAEKLARGFRRSIDPLPYEVEPWSLPFGGLPLRMMQHLVGH